MWINVVSTTALENADKSKSKAGQTADLHVETWNDITSKPDGLCVSNMLEIN